MTGQILHSLWIASAVSVLIAQPLRAEVVQVTGVQLNSTQNGIEVILETPAGKQLQVLPRTDGNTYIANIPNTQLRLPSGNTFRRDNPSKGIAAVTVTNEDANSIRVTVTGSSGAPTVELFDSDEGFIFSFTPAGANTQAEQQTEIPNAVEPGNQTQPNETAAEGDEPIEIVVTATRTEEAVTNVPRSVTVIDREEIEQQTRLSRNLTDILGFTVPGLSPSNQNISSFGQNLRGRNASVLIDGVPQTTNLQTFNRELRTIEPSAIERIEVIRGSSASYGSFEIYKKVPRDSEDFNSYVKLDQFSGKVLYVQDRRRGGLGDRILNSFTPIHYGTFGGLPTRIFYVFVGLAPLVLFITGFVMWRYRYRAKLGSQMNATEPARQQR